MLTMDLVAILMTMIITGLLLIIPICAGVFLGMTMYAMVQKSRFRHGEGSNHPGPAQRAEPTDPAGPCMLQKRRSGSIVTDC